ncbi:MAG: YeeE/YedE family protein [Methanomicrobiales archaeon]|nr:YeeE/YedE family protein [Methanomicrobiales archaeon]
MFEFLAMASWSPYVVGAGIGVLVWTTFLLSDHPLGCSTGYAKAAGMVETAISREKTGSMPYYRQFVPTVDWWSMLIIGLVIGAFLSATLSGTFSIVLVPPMFAEAFGTGWPLRFAVAVAGGILLGLGARWAGGCTSGHGISGTLQLSVASWVAATCFFAGGILVAALLYGSPYL